MDLARLQPRSLSQAVFETLRDAILCGELAAGERLPSERALCEKLGVNRAAVREALKRLQELRLVAIRQGESTRVLDYRRTGGLELVAAMLFDREGGLRSDVVRSLVELRTALGPDIAALAARRRSDAEVAELRGHLAAMRSLPTDDAVALQRVHLELWRVLVRASRNLAYQLAFNTMERAWVGIQDAIAPAMSAEVGFLRGYRALVDAVGDRDEAQARGAARELVRRGAAGMLALLPPAKEETR